ncbi:MAG: cytochrome c [Planctomycetes bacterium]|nr:cytochrome c [Planctomycetota bacterium]
MNRSPLPTVRYTALPCLLAIGLFGSSCADLEGHRDRHPNLSPPPIGAAKAEGFEGLHNVVTYAPDMFSGSVPEGEEGMETLAAMGVKSIVSVDGATPDVATAEKLGMHYVHLPIPYSGMTEARQKEIAQAVANLPGPVYVHCHHGKHRSAAALGSAMVLAGKLTPEQAQERMKVSGTSPDYPGLWQAVRQARPLASSDLVCDASKFPSVNVVSGMVAMMSEIDAVMDNVKQARKAGWKAPEDHPDLVPSKETRRLAHVFAQLAQDPESLQHQGDYQELLKKSITAAEQLDAALRAADLPLAEQHFDVISKTCKQCHKSHRDQ